MTVFHVKFALQSQLRNVMLNFVSNPIETVIINQPLSGQKYQNWYV